MPTTSFLLMIAGFAICSYSMIANNMPQTLGPFIRSNPGRAWWINWIFAAVVMLGVIFYGWIRNNGDVCYGRLDAIPLPDRYIWIHLVPPLALLAMTRFGIPVSPTFLIVPAFATAALAPMLRNALAGYAVGFAVSGLLYLMLSQVERRFIATKEQPPAPEWRIVQFFASGFLWSQWLIQNLANAFAYVPRQLSIPWLIFICALMVLLLGLVMRARGGATQGIVNSKTNLQDVRSATLLDLLYGSLLLAFLQTSAVPMSTTWVFLGVIGAREIILNRPPQSSPSRAVHGLARELRLAVVGLALSLSLAYVLPMFHAGVDRTFNVDGDVIPAATVP
jgi:hypothetical protein